MSGIINIVIDNLAEELFHNVRSDLVEFYGRHSYIDALFVLLYHKTILYSNVTLPLDYTNAAQLFNRLYSLEFGEEGELLDFQRHSFVQNTMPMEYMLNGHSYHVEDNTYSPFRIDRNAINQV